MAIAFSENDEHWMQCAIDCAKQAAAVGEVPVGAVIVKNNELIAQSFNQPIRLHDPTAHAEVMVMRAAAQVLTNYRLVDTTMYVTLEPCAMCVGAIAHARIARIVYAASDPKSGAVVSACALAEQPHFNHYALYEAGCCEAQASDMLRAFFQARR